MIILICIRKPHKEEHKLWKHLLKMKIILMLPLLNPLINWFFDIVGISLTSVPVVQFVVVITILLISVSSRYYREDVTKGFTADNRGNTGEFQKFSDET